MQTSRQHREQFALGMSLRFDSDFKNSELRFDTTLNTTSAATLLNWKQSKVDLSAAEKRDVATTVSAYIIVRA